MYVGYIVVSCLQLGATIDYSILMTEKYINARTSMNKADACREAVRGSALSILTSGSILAIVGYGLYFFSSVEAIGGMGRMVGRGALCSLVLVLGMLPPLLYYTDRLFIKSPEHPGFKKMLNNLAYRGGRFLTRTHEDVKVLIAKLKTKKGDDNDENND